VRLVIVVLLAACSEKTADKPPQIAAASGPQIAEPPTPDAAAIVPDAKPPDPPRVALGDCAPTAMQFVSGPKPIAFTSKEGVRNAGVLGADNLGVAGLGFRGAPSGPGDIGIGNIGTRRQQQSTVTITRPVVEGKLDADVVRRHLKRQISKFQFCFEREVLVDPLLTGGTATAAFVITAIGATHVGTVGGVQANVDACIAGVISRIEFPKTTESEDRGIVKVHVQFKFVGIPTPRPRPIATPPKPKPTAPYVVDAKNPLKGREPALAECLAKSSKPYGVAVVDFTYDAAGAVKTAKAHNLDPDVATCVEAVAAQAQRITKATTERCSLAFGTMPITDLPTDNVTPDKTSPVQIIGPVLRSGKPIEMPVPVVPVPITAQGTW
jgi:hypothetical protein